MKMENWLKLWNMIRGKRSINLLSYLILAVACGTSCEQGNDDVVLTDLTGIFSCQESSPHSGIRKYLVEIDKVAHSENRYIISNFHNMGENEFIYADYQRDTLWILNQAISELSVDGAGPVERDYRSIYLYYTTDDGITVYDYYVNYTR